MYRTRRYGGRDEHDKAVDTLLTSAATHCLAQTKASARASLVAKQREKTRQRRDARKQAAGGGSTATGGREKGMLSRLLDGGRDGSSSHAASVAHPRNSEPASPPKKSRVKRVSFA